MSKKIKFVIVGFGNMGRDWLKVLRKDKRVKVVGVVDVIDKSLSDGMQILNLGNNAVGKNLKTVIQETKPDAILDTSPPFNHKIVSTTAMKMGCHILGEKPIALSLEEAKQIIKLSISKNRIYMINQNYRWNPIFQIIRKYLQTKKIGKIHTITIHYSQNFNFKDAFRYKMDHPLLVDMSVHHFDLVRALTGSNMKEVYCREYNVKGSKFKNGSTASAIFTLRDGIMFNYIGSWSDLGKNSSFMGVWKISAEKGIITWDGINAPIVEMSDGIKIITKKLSSKSKLKSDSMESFMFELSETLSRFIEAITMSKQPETYCGDNIHTLEMVLGAIESSKVKSIKKHAS